MINFIALKRKFIVMVADPNKDSHDLHVSLEKDIFDKFESIKEYHGIKNSTEIIRFLITKEHREVEKYLNSLKN